MAYTVSKTPFSAGSKAGVLMQLTADAATQTVETGLSVIEGLSCHLGSAATQVGVAVRPNKNASGVAANGSLGISGCTSGDDLFIVVYGH